MHHKERRLAQLLEAAEGMSSRNHERFIRDALEALQRTGSPDEALKFLEALKNSVFASRPEPRRALEKVIDWLRARLAEGSGVTAAELAWELGWLRRLGRFRSKAPAEHRGNHPREHSSDSSAGRNASTAGSAARAGSRESSSFGQLGDQLKGLKLQVKPGGKDK